MKQLHLILFLLSLLSCAPKKQLITPSQAAPKPYLEAARNFLEKKIADKDLRDKIVFDTIMRHTSNMVLFHVQNDSSNMERNMILVHVKEDLSVDTLFTKINPEQIKKHLKAPSIYPLLLSRQGAVQIAKQNGMKDGIGAWTINLVCYGAKRDNVQWTIRNTERQSTSGAYRASGQSININIETRAFELGKWDAIE